MGLKTYSEKFIVDILNLNLKTPPDIVYGLVNLSGSGAYSSYINSRGKDAQIKTDKESVTIQDAGNIVQDAVSFRNKLLNQNLETPSDITYGIKTTVDSLSTVNNFLSGRGLETNIHDYKVNNSGDVVSNSVKYRNTLMNKNLQTPQDVASYLSIYFLNDRGEQATINDYAVNDAGTTDKTIDYSADRERAKAFNKNKPISKLDPSENDPLYYDLSGGDYNYTSLLDSIGQMIDIRDLNIPNSTSVSIESNQTPEIALDLNLQQNRYIPQEINTYEPTISLLNKGIGYSKYKLENAGSTYGQLSPQTYEPSSFVSINNLNNYSSVMSESKNDPLEYLLTTSKPPLKDETLLMNIAALELKFNFESRLKQAIERETIGKTAIDESLTNPVAAANMLVNPYRWGNIFERNYNISISSNPIGKAAEFIGSLSGLENPIALDFALSTRDDLTPSCFSNSGQSDIRTTSSLGAFYQDVIGRTTSRKNDYNAYFLERTGSGQKFSLFYSIAKNKYRPDYLANYQSLLATYAQAGNQIINNITGFLGLSDGKTPSGNYYIGSKETGDDPFYLLQDSDGDQVRSNEILTKSITDNNQYDESGYRSTDNMNIGVSDYGSITTNFIWKKRGSFDNIKKDGKTEQINNVGILKSPDSREFSYNKRFRDCSILDKTEQLLDKGVNSIDQTISKFYDNYMFASKGSGVIRPEKLPNIDKDGNIIGYKYKVNGLVNGKRNDVAMYNEAPLCRTWLKTKPYGTIGDSIRFKELIRRERNSVIDRYGNYNIFPSDLNVNTGYGRNDGNVGSAKVEYFGVKKARKYMFSIENLAWRDYSADTYYGKTDLPFCEQGPNGGRVMWFPPYDLIFTDDTRANWTTHQFLGRPEPIYTYNNSERSGTLSWKIIVDHPSILNVLVRKELAKLSDGEVDEILAAFWSGCIEFDTFELARIWDQFSQSDIEYFKLVLAEMDLSKPNDELKPILKNIQSQSANPNKEFTDIIVPAQKKIGKLFFENDVPLNPNEYKENIQSPYDTGKIETFNKYFQRYLELGTNTNTINVNYVKNTKVKGERVNYYFTIGNEKMNEYNTELQNLFLEFGSENYKYEGFDLDVLINAHASPIAPGANQNQVKEYNDLLANRRFISTIKWIIFEAYMGESKARKDELFTDQECNTLVTDEYFNDNKNEYILYRKNIYGTIDKITFKLGVVEGKTFDSAIEESIPNPEKYLDYRYFITDLYVSGMTADSTPKPCYCFENKQIVDNVKDKLTDSTGSLVPNEQIGAMFIDDNTQLTDADVSCSILSYVASYSRRSEVIIIAGQGPTAKKIADEDLFNIENIAKINYNPNKYNTTKREIAQKILNKVINECDYFDLLREESPTVYNSLKEKLKYFSPSFHSMTPEGLNARLTFLQQCLRPGETIKKEYNGENESCDASNTAFGKPPICVLRIGDFYNTKIIINSLNIQYDNNLLDLNPEGIGVQPMIATISLGFNYIGGSGLRKPVEELQNALSFNFYANTDMYDDRTYANKNQYERDLINLEQSYFDSNSLDLISIVDAAEKITPTTFLSDLPVGTIGEFTKTNQLQIAGGEFGLLLLNANDYDSSKIYQPYNIVNYESGFYNRKKDYPNDPTKKNTEIVLPTNTKYWEEVIWKNYGEEPFQLEFGMISSESNEFITKYFNTYKVNYKPLFTELYSTYGEILTNNIKLNTEYSDYEVLSALFLTGRLPASSNQTMVRNYFNEIAEQKGYVEYGQIKDHLNTESFINFKNEIIYPIKSHLYPQKHMFKIGDGKLLTNVKNGLKSGIFGLGDRYDAGNLTNGSNNTGLSEMGGLFVNGTSDVFDILYLYTDLYNELIDKTKNHLNHFWVFDEKAKNINKKYHQLFDPTEKSFVTDLLINKLKTYYELVYNKYSDGIQVIESNHERLLTINSAMGVILEGYDLNSNGQKLYEVIPNESILNRSIKELFGYDPYESYKKINSNITDDNLITFKDVKDIYCSGNINDIITLGNGIYFFKQITKDPDILYLLPTGYTNDSNLPVSWVIKNNIDLDSINKYNFTFEITGVTLNTSLDKNAKAGITNIYDLSTIIDDNRYLNDDYYPMTYTFEKLNYEFLEFTNKTIDVMLNDTINNIEYTINIDSNYSFKKQIDNLPSGNTLNKLFKITNDLKYYEYNGTQISIENVNNFIKYEYQLIKEIDPNIKGDLINEIIDMSAFVDTLFIGFINNITESDIENVTQKIVSYNSKNNTANQLASKKSLVKDIFANIKRYFNEVNKLTKPIYDENKIKASESISAIGNAINDNTAVSQITTTFIVNSLLKGFDDDYTVTVKDAELPNDFIRIIKSYELFQKNRDRFGLII